VENQEARFILPSKSTRGRKKKVKENSDLITSSQLPSQYSPKSKIPYSDPQIARDVDASASELSTSKAPENDPSEMKKRGRKKKVQENLELPSDIVSDVEILEREATKTSGNESIGSVSPGLKKRGRKKKNQEVSSPVIISLKNIPRTEKPESSSSTDSQIPKDILDSETSVPKIFEVDSKSYEDDLPERNRRGKRKSIDEQSEQETVIIPQGPQQVHDSGSLVSTASEEVNPNSIAEPNAENCSIDMETESPSISKVPKKNSGSLKTGKKLPAEPVMSDIKNSDVIRKEKSSPISKVTNGQEGTGEARSSGHVHSHSRRIRKPEKLQDFVCDHLRPTKRKTNGPKDNSKVSQNNFPEDPKAKVITYVSNSRFSELDNTSNLLEVIESYDAAKISDARNISNLADASEILSTNSVSVAQDILDANDCCEKVLNTGDSVPEIPVDNNDTSEIQSKLEIPNSINEEKGFCNISKNSCTNVISEVPETSEIEISNVLSTSVISEDLNNSDDISKVPNTVDIPKALSINLGLLLDSISRETISEDEEQKGMTAELTTEAPELSRRESNEDDETLINSDLEDINDFSKPQDFGGQKLNGIDDTSEVDHAEQSTEEEPVESNWSSEDVSLVTQMPEYVTDHPQKFGNVSSSNEVEIHTIHCNCSAQDLGPSSNAEIEVMDSRGVVPTEEVEGHPETRNVQTEIFADQNLDNVTSSVDTVTSSVVEEISTLENAKENKTESNCKDAICYDGETDKESPMHSSR